MVTVIKIHFAKGIAKMKRIDPTQILNCLFWANSIKLVMVIVIITSIIAIAFTASFSYIIKVKAYRDQMIIVSKELTFKQGYIFLYFITSKLLFLIASTIAIQITKSNFVKKQVFD